MSELLMAKGKLADLKQQLEEVETKAESLFLQLRELLSPYKEFLAIETNKIMTLVKVFRELQMTARQITESLEKIKDTYNL